MTTQKDKPSSVLVLGAAGFVGRHLINSLRKDNNLSVLATKLPNETMDGAPCNVTDLDILLPGQVECLFSQVRPDIVFHLAAQSSVALSWSNPGLTVDVNVKGAVHILEAARKLYPSPKIVLIGSGEEYGRIAADRIPASETLPLHPENIYAATKAMQSMLGAIYSKAYGLDIVMARAFNHIGPGQSPVFVVPSLCRQVVRIEKGLALPVITVGNLDAKRDFTDVRDIVEAYVLLARFGIKGETYNVGSGNAVSVGEILKRILLISPVKIEVKSDPAKMRPADTPIIEADTEKLRQCTGWRPEIGLDQTLRDTMDYWRSRSTEDLSDI